MDRTSVNVAAATRDRLNQVRGQIAEAIGRPKNHVTHDEAIRALLDEHERAALAAEGEAP